MFTALQGNSIAGFAADVLAEEPPVENDPLLQLKNVLITAHLGSLTKTTYTKMCTMTVKNTLAILRNEAPMENCVFNKRTGQQLKHNIMRNNEPIIVTQLLTLQWSRYGRH